MSKFPNKWYQSVYTLIELISWVWSLTPIVMDHGQSLLIPPLFDGINYVYWKIHIKVFLYALGEQVWQVVEVG